LNLDGSWIEVSGSRLRDNLDTFRSLTASGTDLMVVVKSNAYGHGLRIVSKVIAEQADWFGVDALAEALEVQAVAPGKPILIMGHSDIRNITRIVEHGFRQAVYRMDVLEALSAEAKRLDKTAHIHLKIETGTNRLGIPLEEVASFGRRAAGLPGIDVEGVYTHFSNIEDTLDPSFALRQLERFTESLASLESAGVRPVVVHAAATAGILLYPETHFSMVRLGIGTYGIWPSRETQIAARERGRQVTLKSVLTWKTRIAQLKKIEAGEYVGYGLSFRAPRATTIATIPVGYFEGYDRKLSNQGSALVRGKHVPIVGRVAMNMTMLDVTDAGASEDDEVVLLGRQGGREITADEIGDRIGTISYEIVARINPLLERRIV
jgi:alanine racemase